MARPTPISPQGPRTNTFNRPNLNEPEFNPYQLYSTTPYNPRNPPYSPINDHLPAPGAQTHSSPLSAMDSTSTLLPSVSNYPPSPNDPSDLQLQPLNLQPTQSTLGQYLETTPMIETSHSRRSWLGTRRLRRSGIDSSPPEPRSVSPTTIGGGRTYPLWRKFERPQWWLIGLHTVGCIMSFPIVFLLPKATCQGVSLFWARVGVGAICATVGVGLGVSLLYLGRRGIEAAVWATIVHSSTSAHGGLSLREVAFQADPTPLSAVILLFRRWKEDLRNSKEYDKAPWGLVILIFLLVSIAAASLPFILGRTVDIGSYEERQWDQFVETTVVGDLSTDDLSRAGLQVSAMTDFVRTWTLSAFSEASQLPMPVELNYTNPNTKRNETVYFSDTFPSQLERNGTGFGTFFINNTQTFINKPVSSDIFLQDTHKEIGGGPGGQLLRWPRWGIRIQCARVPDLDRNVIISNSSRIVYTFIPRTVLSDLFSSLAIPYPAEILDKPINTTFLWRFEPNNTRPAEVPQDFDFNLVTEPSIFWDNGVAHAFKSNPLTLGAEGNGWLQLETTLVRLDTALCPQASFDRIINATVPEFFGGGSINLGIDVGICVESFSSYIVEAFASKGAKPVTTTLVSKGFSVAEREHQATGKKTSSEPIVNASRALTSAGKADAWKVVHGNSRNVFLKDNGRDSRYAPSPSTVSFTLGSGPEGYLSLDGPSLARAFALHDSTNLLPYLSGSQPLLALSYPDITLASIKASALWIAIVLFCVWLLGIVAALFVPRLPLGEPRRDFSPVSWIVALGLGEGEEDEADLVRRARRGGVQRRMELEELEKRIGSLKIR